MNALIVNNDLTKTANLNALKDTAYQMLSSAKAIDLTSGYSEEKEDYIYKYELKIGACAHRLIIRDIDIKGLPRSRIISHIANKILEENPELVYLHFASYGHANHYKDYITVQVADQLKSVGRIVFFTSGPVDIGRFKEETDYSIFMQTCAEDVLNRVFDDMGISAFLKDGGTSP